MNILVITGSPRKNGNSNILVENFIEGAKENRHNIVRFDAHFKKVYACIACNSCRTKGECSFKDDFYDLTPTIIKADIIVFASPMYYLGFSSQLKKVIDRFYSIDSKIRNNKKTVFLLTYADTSEKYAQPIRSHYESIINSLGWKSVGEVIAKGVWAPGSINETPYPKMAYKLGCSII